jgi:hypothetical protein
MAHLMIVDDGRAGAAEELVPGLRNQRHRVTCVSSAHEAVSHLDRDMPDLIVVPVAILGRTSAPLVGELAERVGTVLPAVAFYWDGVEDGPRGGPSPFGSCWYVARAADLEQTYQRLIACVGQGASPLHLPREPVGCQTMKFVA